MTVSVVIPVFNGAAHLRATIESVLAQKGVDAVEIIVVDDGSTDDSVNVATRFGSQITLIRTDNRGPSRARNIGLDAAHGQYIQFLDADDVLLPHALAKRMTRLETSGSSICISHWHELREGESGVFTRHERSITHSHDFGNTMDVALVNGYWAPPAAWTLKRNHRTNKLRFDERIPLVEDVRFLIDADLQGVSFVEMDACLALYRITSALSLSRRSARQFIAGVSHNALYVDFYWRHSYGLDSEKRRALINVYDYVSRSLYHQDPELFNQVMQHLFSLKPHSVTRPAVVARLTPLIGYARAGDVAKSLAKALSTTRQVTRLMRPKTMSKMSDVGTSR